MVSMDACFDVYRLQRAKRWSRLLEGISTLLVVAQKIYEFPRNDPPGGTRFRADGWHASFILSEEGAREDG
jgi:hypothetical protein